MFIKIKIYYDNLFRKYNNYFHKFSVFNYLRTYFIEDKKIWEDVSGVFGTI